MASLHSADNIRLRRRCCARQSTRVAKVSEIKHLYEVRPRKGGAVLTRRLTRCHSAGCGMGEPHAVSNAIEYAEFRSRAHDAVIRVYDATGNVIETHEHAGAFKEW
jgi:hypothetical protein